jgi:hypothetical protein
MQQHSLLRPLDVWSNYLAKIVDDNAFHHETPGESMDAKPMRTSRAVAASRRLDQLSAHLKPSNVDRLPSTEATDSSNMLPGQRRLKPRSQVEALPPEQSDILSHVNTLKSIAFHPESDQSGLYPSILRRSSLGSRVHRRSPRCKLVPRNRLADTAM